MAEEYPDFCDRCGAIDEAIGNVSLGEFGDELVCVDCRKEELYERTVLSERESHVVATKEIVGGTHEEIGEYLKVSKSTIDEYSRRIQAKIAKAATTTDELARFG